MEMNVVTLDGKHVPSSSSRMAKTRKIRFRKSAISVSSIGLVTIIVGLAVGIFWSFIYDSIFRFVLVLRPSSMSFDMWKETPIPMYLEIRFFNWTNPKDFKVNSRAKPNFVEMGPYVFKEIDYKVNEVWNDNNGTVTFQTKKIWHFDEELSQGSLTDRVTNLNPTATSVAYMLRYKNHLTKIAIDKLIKRTGGKLTVTKTVKELLFDGYDDDLLVVAAGSEMPGLPYDRFAWFYGRNNSDSYDGIYNMLTGRDNVEDIGNLKEWNYSDKSKFYESNCASIKGTLGDLWPPLKDKRTVSVFVPDVCTSMDLVYYNAKEYMGLIGKQYISTKDMLDNGANVPSRACYCKDVDCQPSGTFNVSKCKFGAPAFISLPHFYLADESYRSSINGMHPRKEDHEFSMLIEPNAGIPMQVRARIQLNLLVQPDPHISIFSKVPRTFIPMLWLKQEANLSASLSSQVKLLLALKTMGREAFFCVAGIGFLLLFIGLCLCMCRRRRTSDDRSLIIKVDSNDEAARYR